MTTTQLPTAPLDLVEADAFDLYRQIHKGIRQALFDVTMGAGRLDVADVDAVDAYLAAQESLLTLLHLHHHSEDTFVQPLVVEHAPALAEIIAADHGEVEAGMAVLEERARRLASGSRGGRPAVALNLYLDLSRFTSAYLAHQLVEETRVMPALRAAFSTDELVGVEMAVRSAVSPAELAMAVSYMLPAMNVEERTEMLAGMSMAPPEVFAGFRAVAEAALSPADWAQVAARIGLT